VAQGLQETAGATGADVWGRERVWCGGRESRRIMLSASCGCVVRGLEELARVGLGKRFFICGDHESTTR